MELLIEENGKKVFVDGENKTYCMLNMGNYVGYRFRQWYELSPEVWKLMFLDEKLENGQCKHIEALVDDQGNYIRFIIDIENARRIIQINNGFVFNDFIVTNLGADGSFENIFNALDGNIYSENKISLNEYLSLKQNFIMNDNLYDGEVSNNDLIKDFLTKNDELLELMKSNKVKRKYNRWKR